MTKPKEKPVCTQCGSDDVLADAYAWWDVDKQEWALSNTFDNSYCEDCEGECSLEWVPADEDEDAVSGCSG